MLELLNSIVTADANAVTSISTILKAAKLRLGAAARRDELVCGLSNSGFKLAVLNGQIHALGCRLAT